MSEILRGVKLACVDRKHLTKVVKSLNLSTDTSIDSMVVSLADHLIRKHKLQPEQLLDCNFCSGPSDATFSVCPYCGKSDEEADKAVAEAEAKAAEEAAKKPAEPEAKSAKKPRSSAAAKKDPPAPPAKPEKQAKPPGVKKTKSAALAIVQDPVVHQAELVSSDPNALGTVADLDEKVANIRKIQVDLVDGHWQLGKLLGETWTMYKLRVEEGKPKYRNWGQFVSSELGFTPQYAYDLVGVSTAFTEADIRLVGVTKLRIIARIPDEAKRQNLLERAKNELGGKPMTRNEIDKEAKAGGDLPNRKALGGGSVGGDAAAIKRKEKAEERAKNKGVSVVIQPGRVTIPLYNAKLSKKEPVRAFDLSDEPHGVEDMLNGIKVRYVLSKEQDGLVLTVERVRE